MSQTILPTQQSMHPELMTVEEFAVLLKASRTTIFNRIKLGELQEGVHFFRLGNILRFRWLDELFFNKKPQNSSRNKKLKRPTTSTRSTTTESSVNLDYGALQ